MLINLLEQSCSGCPAKELSFFNTVKESELECLDHSKTCSLTKKGQIIFSEGNIPKGIHCVQSGKIKLYKTGSNGKEQIMYFAQPGDFLGYKSLIANEKHDTTAEAIEESRVCFIPEDAFINILDRNPDLSKKMLKSLCHELNIAGEKLQSMAQKSVRERLAETLLVLQNTFKLPNQEDNTINITLPREDIANLVGTSTETVIRLLSEMKEDGLIDYEGRKIKLLNSAKLKRIAVL